MKIEPKLHKGTEDKHHILPRSRNGVDTKQNIIKLNIDIHRALHRLFGNMTIDEQLKRLEEISHKGLRAEFREELLELLTRDKEYYYDKGIYKSKII